MGGLFLACLHVHCAGRTVRVLSLSPVTEAVIFFAAIVTLTSAILAAIYFLLRDPQPQRDHSKD